MSTRTDNKPRAQRTELEGHAQSIGAQFIDIEPIAALHKDRLYKLFEYVEKEIDALYEENCALRTKVNQLSERLGEPVSTTHDFISTTNESLNTRKETSRKGNQMRQKLKTALRVPPGRLVQSLKVGVGDGSRHCKFVRSLQGHRDGIWHLSTSRGAQQLILASASADQTCLLWSPETGACLAQYIAHAGSVNGVAFSPKSADHSDPILSTASGDRTAHIWKFPSNVHAQQQLVSSEEDDAIEHEQSTVVGDFQGADISSPIVIRQPLLQLTGHTGAVMAVEWFSDGEQLITASWDRTANIYDSERGEILNVLSGHDGELNHCSAHSSQKLIVTASRDSTFRLWDFREPIQSVAVFQGHNDSVTSVVFSTGEKLVSGSDDRSIKVWDLRNMRSAIVTVRLDSAVNRLAISSRSVVAIPQDNRNIRLYDLNSVRLTRLPRSSSQSHRRMVCGAAWADDHQNYDLFTCGFDKQVIVWKTSYAKE